MGNRQFRSRNNNHNHDGSVPADNPSHQMAVTNFSTEKGKFTWKINNFSFVAMEDELFSPSFKVANATWCLELRFHNMRNPDEFMELYLNVIEIEGGTMDPVWVKSDIYLMHPEREKHIVVFEDVEVFSPYSTPPGSPGSGWTRWINNRKLKSYINNDSITIMAELEIFVGEIESKEDTIFAIQKMEPPSSFHQDMAKLIQDKLSFSSVKLKVEGEEIPVHTDIICARSPVFEAMFRHQMRESQKGLVEIEDIPKAAVKEMLHFLYTDQCTEKLKDVARDLVVAAEKYQIPRLKYLCERNLIEQVTIETAPELLLLGHQISAEALLRYCLDFVVSHFSEIRDNKGFQKILNDGPLVMQILESFGNIPNSDPRKRLFAPKEIPSK